MKTGEPAKRYSSRKNPALKENEKYIWGLASKKPPEVTVPELEEKLQGDVEPEPEQTIVQELQDLELLGKWEEGVPAVEYSDEEVVYDFPVTVNRQVQYYLDFFTGKQRDSFALWLSRSGRYLPMIQEELRAAGLPEDLVYLAMIESGYNERAYSRARAVGIWQFIKATARNYGLEINTYVDERRDPVKSTQAAVSYLSDLYDEFGSWYLAVAAYNAGEGKIRRAMKKYKTADFWEIAQGRYLRLETKRYVPKLIAAIIIAKEPEKYGFDNIEYEPPLAYETVSLPRWTALEAVALACDMDPAELKKYNNHLRRGFTPPDKASYPFKVPAGKKEQVARNLPRVQAVVSTGFKTHTVGEGETLNGICKKYGLTKTLVLKSNNLRSSGLIAGQRLRIPYQTTSYEMLPEGSIADGYLTAEAADGNFILHEIRPGETVSELSRKYSVPVHLIAAWNDLHDISRIRAGQQLIFHVRNSNNRIAAVSKGNIAPKRLAPSGNMEAAGPGAKHRRDRDTRTAVRGEVIADDNGSGPYYIVQQGDSLWAIAQHYNLDINELQQINGLATNVIQPGDRILLAKSRSTDAEFYYHVRRGDSLWTIARKYDISADEIKRWNNIRGNLIHPGNQLLLKVADTGETQVDTFYRVRSGDSLWTIARKHNTSPEEIRKLNNLKGNAIYPGNRLLLKSASGG
ncbi:MAG: LysM peptidoglycan-binding domain-containing protein [Desulfobulbales bacterium]|nr:LysM peptidoglycan-binding domain-containing protein [Desulfobulbales bacterium]